ncbi:hypothetical protein ACGFIV_03275 [Sphaerisporangium sp. NPDC049003]|uniref:hypothetical protein n=1 Tax=Sphaerisporangium sp. NPDC049003 TaxID=3364517 RepID=UPI00371602D7
MTVRKIFPSFATGVICAVAFLLTYGGMVPLFAGLTTLDVTLTGVVALTFGWALWLGEHKAGS